MKKHLALFILYLCFLSSFSQTGYPEPKKTKSRLFYIQHSNNHNTYVYDANIKNGTINALEPINEYRIVYTENAEKEPLSNLQKRLAYGMELVDSQTNLWKFHLAATEDLFFYLNYTKIKGARIYVTVNKHKMYLDKMFVQLKDGFLGTSVKPEFVIFYGTDFNSGIRVTEKVLMN
ncbi:DUF4833 domain-containing protein [Bizionia argentinensis JUB59]|uniref:DUF4833 domain-containing protein n=1 Tax=Bizionia argentinensis JUB59 TaxID=1046627 RepID=G2EGW5_9FLAO|nr:DUF4833 domain-containing protein [Bizionia argentinensis]EGV42340.1 DUF4833 domain-containing protein [Bizionia argentinensis JUB59]